MTHLDLKKIFTYHFPTLEPLEEYEIIRLAAMEFANTVVKTSPPSADQTAAIWKIRAAAMDANAAIALQDKLFA